MKKADLILISILLLIGIILTIIFSLIENSQAYAIVYHKNEEVLRIDLSIDYIYEVEGNLGIVTLEVKDGQIRMLEAHCPDKICEEIGFTNSSLRPIICVPNEIYIKLVSASELDVIIG